MFYKKKLAQEAYEEVTSELYQKEKEILKEYFTDTLNEIKNKKEEKNKIEEELEELEQDLEDLKEGKLDKVKKRKESKQVSQTTVMVVDPYYPLSQPSLSWASSGNFPTLMSETML